MANTCLVYHLCQARLNVIHLFRNLIFTTTPRNSLPISERKKLKHREVKQFLVITQLTEKPGFEPQQAGSTICVLYDYRTSASIEEKRIRNAGSISNVRVCVCSIILLILPFDLCLSMSSCTSVSACIVLKYKLSFFLWV